MPLYHFDVAGALRAKDPEGITYKSDLEALGEAELDARELWAEAIRLGNNPRQITLEVRTGSRILQRFQFDKVFASG